MNCDACAASTRKDTTEASLGSIFTAADVAVSRRVASPLSTRPLSMI